MDIKEIAFNEFIYFSDDNIIDIELIDSSRHDNDTRYNYIITTNNSKFVLKAACNNFTTVNRVKQWSRLIDRYNDFGLYAPQIIRSKDKDLAYTRTYFNKNFVIYLEEYGIYNTVSENDNWIDIHKEIMRSLAAFCNKYKNYDLVDSKTSYNLIETFTKEDKYDEKQENAIKLFRAFREHGLEADLIGRIISNDKAIRKKVKEKYFELPRIVVQGDLNQGNVLTSEGKFVGLIDFNLSGSDCILNYALNESCYFLKICDLNLTKEKMVEKFKCETLKRLTPFLESYQFNDLEKKYFNDITKLVIPFRWPNVSDFIYWLNQDKDKYMDKFIYFLEYFLENGLFENIEL